MIRLKLYYLVTLPFFCLTLDLIDEGLPDNTASVIPNDKTEALLSGNPSSIRSKVKEKKGTNYPSKEEIDSKRSELLKEDPDFYSDPAELNDELEYFIDNYKGVKESDTFTMEDVQKLGKISTKNERKPFEIATTSVSPKAVKSEKLEAEKPESLENKQGLFSRIFGKNETKPNEKPGEGGINTSSILSKGSQLLSSVPQQLNGKFGFDTGKASSALGAVSKLEIPKLLGQSTSINQIGPKNAPNQTEQPESKSSISLLSKKIPTPKSAASAQNQSDSNVMNSISDITSKSGMNEESPNKSVAVKPTEGEEAKKTEGSSEGQGSPVDMSEVVDVLSKILSALNGPLNVSPMDSPFRPDSRRV